MFSIWLHYTSLVKDSKQFVRKVVEWVDYEYICGQIRLVGLAFT